MASFSLAVISSVISSIEGQGLELGEVAEIEA